MAAENSLENFTCSICRDVFQEPVIIPCGNTHVVCCMCIGPVIKDAEPKCPICRTVFNARRISPHQKLAEKMRTTTILCNGCQTPVLVTEMTKHLATCGGINRDVQYFKPVKDTKQQVPKCFWVHHVKFRSQLDNCCHDGFKIVLTENLPNRCTFPCPYCDMKNFDINSLKDHCNVKHKAEAVAVVCPVCVSMPWGNKNQKSVNFIRHLNIRHKFEYDTYVDYAQDDDVMLKAALQASLESD